MAALLDRPPGQMHVTLLGQFKLCRPGAPSDAFTIKSKKGRALLAYLAMQLDGSVPRARVAALLWPEQPERVGRQSLRQILTELRDEIGPEFDSGISKEEIQLSGRHFEVDAVKFAECGQRGDYETAVSLYSGDLTADLEIRSGEFDEWLALERRKLHALALEVFDAHARTLEAGGQKEKALKVCERLLALDPFRETTHRLIIRLEAVVNGRSSAVARANKFTKALRDQLGVSPEPETEALIASISGKADNSFQRSDAGLIATPARNGNTRTARWKLPVAVALALLVTAGAVAWRSDLIGFNQRLAIPPAPTQVASKAQKRLPADSTYAIVVVPFSVRTDSDRVKRFANALEEDVIDSLAHAPRFLVISRQTSRSYRNTEKDAREIGKELGIDFLLSGNVDAEGDKIFVRAQLTDARTGLQIWTDRFTHSGNAGHDVFEEIVLAVARQLQVQIILSEGAKRSRLERQNPTYGDLIQRGWAEAFNSFTVHENAELALELFEKAAALEPRHAAARVGIASILTRRAAELRSPDRAKDVARAEMLLTDVLLEHPENSTAHYFLGITRKLQGNNAESVVEFEKALRINPSNANAYAQLGHSLIFLGRAAEAKPHIRKAIRLSPKDPTVSSWYLFAGQADLHLRRYDEAIRWLEQSVELYPRSGRTHIFLAAAHMLNGNTEQAVKAARVALIELPNFRSEALRRQTSDATPEYLAEQERIIDAIEKTLVLIRRN